jgi:predicted CXXCH cytochrome family protein
VKPEPSREETLKSPPAGVRPEREPTVPAHEEGVRKTLRDLVAGFQICFEALPDKYVVNKELLQIGFTLELTGTHEQGVEHPLPGCEHCRKGWRALKGVADWVIPREERDSDSEIGPFDQSIHYDPVRKFRPDVSLRIWIRHRSGFDRPVDACEVRCLNKMTQHLEALGVRKGKWVFIGKQLRSVTARDTVCFTCHADKQGPFVFEHQPVKTEGCESCHSPHGSPNPHLLKTSNLNVFCLKCHTGSTFGKASGTPDFHNQAAQFQACALCHVALHGSNFDRHFLK